MFKDILWLFRCWAPILLAFAESFVVKCYNFFILIYFYCFYWVAALTLQIMEEGCVLYSQDVVVFMVRVWLFLPAVTARRQKRQQAHWNAGVWETFPLCLDNETSRIWVSDTVGRGSVVVCGPSHMWFHHQNGCGHKWSALLRNVAFVVRSQFKCSYLALMLTQDIFKDKVKTAP